VIVDANGSPVRRLADLIDPLDPVKSVDLKVQSGGTTKIVRVEVTDISRTQS
jgi:hypothetical protein